MQYSPSKQLKIDKHAVQVKVAQLTLSLNFKINFQR